MTAVPPASIFATQLLQEHVVPTFVLDGEGRVIIWNRACERLTGMPADRIIGTRDHWTALYEFPRPCLADLVLTGATPDRLKELYAVDRTGETELGTFSVENWCLFPKAKSKRYLAIDAGPVYSDNGTIIAVVETLRDITSQKEAQNALEALVGRDGLTGIANRRSFDQRIVADWADAVANRRSISLLMIDIDHFKPYNDTLGHQRGDDCLKRIAKIIERSIRRETDLVARYGGEEFAVVLPGAGAKSAQGVADRILQAIRTEAIDHPGVADSTHVTLSVGISSRSKTCDTPEALIAEADAALYLAKRSGRDRSVAQPVLMAA